MISVHISATNSECHHSIFKLIFDFRIWIPYLYLYVAKTMYVYCNANCKLFMYKVLHFSWPIPKEKYIWSPRNGFLKYVYKNDEMILYFPLLFSRHRNPLRHMRKTSLKDYLPTPLIFLRPYLMTKLLLLILSNKLYRVSKMNVFQLKKMMMIGPMRKQISLYL